MNFIAKASVGLIEKRRKQGDSVSFLFKHPIVYQLTWVEGYHFISEADDYLCYLCAILLSEPTEGSPSADD